MSKPKTCVKVSLLSLNTMFLVFGSVCIALGAFYLNNLDELSALVNTNLPVGIIVLGAIVFVLSFFGCCGAAIESRFMLLTYIFTLLAVMVCQIAVGAAAFKKASDISTTMKAAWGNLTTDSRTWLETKFACCGWDETLKESTCTPEQPYCGVTLIEFFQKNLNVIAFVGVVFGCLEVIGLFFAVILYCCINVKLKKKRKEEGSIVGMIVPRRFLKEQW